MSTTEPVSASFAAIGTTNRVLATVGSSLPDAVDQAKRCLEELDRAVSRFRDDSEVSQLARLAETAEAWYFGSRLFTEHVDAARRAARISGGLVDFTVGSSVIATGYDADLAVVSARESYRLPVTPVKGPGWERVVRGGGGRIGTPRGTVLDFGATAKAHAADTIAGLLARSLPGGFLVNLGGDIATAGPAPEGGWRVGVEAADGGVRQVVAITDQGIATSSTQLRRWQTDAGTVHHIVDPRTGRTASTVWATVTCVAANALEANTASTAAVVLGEAAPAWLTANGVAARLERPDGAAVLTPGWPQPFDEGSQP
ncbi:MAG: FAD:protein FMN transferase [Propionicimonas sp.]